VLDLLGAELDSVSASACKQVVEQEMKKEKASKEGKSFLISIILLK
jgi:hypothetical protein